MQNISPEIVAETKRCPWCEECKTLDKFTVQKNGKPSSFCIECQKDSKKRYLARIRSDKEIHRVYKRRQAAGVRRYRARKKAEGYKFWVTVPERLQAIMQLI